LIAESLIQKAGAQLRTTYEDGWKHRYISPALELNDTWLPDIETMYTPMKYVDTKAACRDRKSHRDLVR
jgi:hypothetical protein